MISEANTPVRNLKFALKRLEYGTHSAEKEILNDNACIESFHFVLVLVHLVWWISEVLTPFDRVVRFLLKEEMDVLKITMIFWINVKERILEK